MKNTMEATTGLIATFKVIAFSEEDATVYQAKVAAQEAFLSKQKPVFRQRALAGFVLEVSTGQGVQICAKLKVGAWGPQQNRAPWRPLARRPHLYGNFLVPVPSLPYSRERFSRTSRGFPLGFVYSPGRPGLYNRGVNFTPSIVQDFGGKAPSPHKYFP